MEGMRLLSRVLYHLIEGNVEVLCNDDLIDTITIVLCLQRRLWAKISLARRFRTM